jgi:peptidyl-prolyl cis-trans isomerase SurA
MLFGHWFVNIEEMKIGRYIVAVILTMCFYLGCMAQDSDASLYLLKVDYAKLLKLDTLPEIAEKMEMYKRNQLFSSFVQSIPVDVVSTQNKENVDAILVKQVFRKTPQNITTTQLKSIQQQMDSVYQQLGRGASFDELVERYSDSKAPLLVRKLQMPEEFEQRVFSMREGEVSTPFESPLGFHIVQVVGKETVPSKDLKNTNALSLAGLTENLKKELGFSREEENCKDLLRRGETDRTLFTIAGKSYTGIDFARFYKANYGGLSTKLDEFITKCLIDAKLAQLQETGTPLSSELESYKNDLLVSEATFREIIRPSQDEQALKAYFDTHKDDFRWAEERYKGALIQGTTKKLVKQARNLLKKSPYESWESLISQRFAVDGAPVLKLVKGVFAAGDNPYVDAMVFKGAKAAPDASFPYAAVQGKKIKGPETYEGVPREQLVETLQSFLENQWIKRLKSSK